MKDPGYVKSMGAAARKRYDEFSIFRRNMIIIRAHNDISGEALSELLNCRPNRINDLECGRCPPKFDEIRVIAKHFSVTIDQLLYKKAIVTFEF